MTHGQDVGSGRRLRLAWSVVLVAVVAAGAGWGLAALVSRPARSAVVLPAPASVVSVDRTSRTQAGAVAGAVRYATLLSELFPLDRVRARQVVGDAASQAYRPVLLSAVDSDLVPLQEQAARLPASTVYRQSVLATRVESYTVDSAAVSVWVLACVGQSGQQANPLGSFATFTLGLVWQAGAWRLDATQQRPGPTPLLDGTPMVVDAFDAALKGFADWRPA